MRPRDWVCCCEARSPEWLRREPPDPRPSGVCSHWPGREYLQMGLVASVLLGRMGGGGCRRAGMGVFTHTPSMRISMTSFTLKLSSSTSWPTYWYRARHRGPCVRGWGLGRPTPGTGRCPTLRFLCMLWAQGAPIRVQTLPCPLCTSWGCPLSSPTLPHPGQAR